MRESPRSRITEEIAYLAEQDVRKKNSFWRRGGFELPSRIDWMEVIEFPKRTKRRILHFCGFEVRNRNAGLIDPIHLQSTRTTTKVLEKLLLSLQLIHNPSDRQQS
jgi:hypothetical protein